MKTTVTVDHVSHRWVVNCSRCGEIARRELDIDAESCAQRHMAEHDRQRQAG